MSLCVAGLLTIQQQSSYADTGTADLSYTPSVFETLAVATDTVSGNQIMYGNALGATVDDDGGGAFNHASAFGNANYQELVGNATVTSVDEASSGVDAYAYSKVLVSSQRTVRVNYTNASIGAVNVLVNPSLHGSEVATGAGAVSVGYIIGVTGGTSSYQTSVLNDDDLDSGGAYVTGDPIQIMNVANGGIIQINSSLEILAQSGDEIENQLGLKSASGSAVGDVSQTTWYQLSSDTPGVTFETSDGADLTLPSPDAPVPEPTLAFLPVAGAVLAIRRKRQLTRR